MKCIFCRNDSSKSIKHTIRLGLGNKSHVLKKCKLILQMEN